MTRVGLLGIVSAAVSLAWLTAGSSAPTAAHPKPPKPSGPPRFDRTEVERFVGESGRNYIIKRVITDYEIGATVEAEAFFNSHLGKYTGWVKWTEENGERIAVGGGPDHTSNWPDDNPIYADIKADLGIRDRGDNHGSKK